MARTLPAESSAPNANAVAIIIGVEGYQSLPAATYANRDAQMFFDFAQLALGIPVGNIRLLVDKEATDIEIFRAFQQWLPALVPIQNMHLDNYRLTGPAQSAFISHYRVRDGQIFPLQGEGRPNLGRRY